MRYITALAALSLVIGASCAPSADGGSEPGSSATSASSATESVETSGCELAEQLFSYEPLRSEMPAAELDDYLTEKQRLYDDLAATDEGSIDGMDDLVATERLADESLQKEWGANGTELFDQARREVTPLRWLALSGQSVTIDGVEQTWTINVDSHLQVVMDRVLLQCLNAPRNIPTPPVSQQTGLPGVELIATSVDEPRSSVHFTFPSGDSNKTLDGEIIQDVSADGTQGLTTDSDGYILIVDLESGQEETLDWAGEGWTCVSWTQDMTTILGVQKGTTEQAIVSSLIGEEDQNLGALTKASLSDRRVVSRQAPEIDVGCPVDAGDDTVIFTAYTWEDNTLNRTPLGDGFGDQITEIWRSEECNMVTFSDAVKSNTLFVIANCDNPYDDGLYEVDLTTTDREHLLHGQYGIGTTSPDGSIHAFTYAEPGKLDYTLHLASSDFKQIWNTGERYAFPTIFESKP